MGLIANVLANAAAGGLEGTGEGAAKEGELSIKAYNQENHDRMLQQLTAEREARNIALTGEQHRMTERDKPRTIAPGSTERRQGEPDFTAPIKTTPEELKLYESHAAYYNALAESVRRGDREKNKKTTLPNIKVEKDDNGNVYNIDQNSGAIGTIIPGAPATEGKSHWFSQDEPGKPAGAHQITWQLNGKPLPNGLGDLYPDINTRSADVNATAAPGVAPKPAGARPPLTSFFPSAQAAPQAPARAPANAQASAQPHAPASAQQPVQDQSGVSVDAARAKLSSAQVALQRFGLTQQKRDPQGYAAAQQAVAAARQDLDTSMSQYQNELGPVGAATPPLRTK